MMQTVNQKQQKELQKKLGSSYALYRACVELPDSEQKFREDLGKKLVGYDPYLKKLAPELQIYNDLKNTHAFEKLDVTAAFLNNQADAIVQNICDETIKHLINPEVASNFINASCGKEDFDVLCKKLDVKVKAMNSVAILPVQRVPRYDILLAAINNEAEKKNRNLKVADELEKLAKKIKEGEQVKGRTEQELLDEAQKLRKEAETLPTLSSETIKKLEATRKQVEQFGKKILNKSVAYKSEGNPLKKNEIHSLIFLMRQNILLDEKLDDKQLREALPDITNVIFTKQPKEIETTLKKYGFNVTSETAKAIKQDFCYTKIEPAVIAYKDKGNPLKENEIHTLLSLVEQNALIGDKRDDKLKLDDKLRKELPTLAFLMKQNILVGVKLDDKLKEALPKITNVIVTKQPKEIEKTLKKYGFNVTSETAKAIKQDFYYSKIDPAIREKIRNAMFPKELHVDKEHITASVKWGALTSKSTTQYLIDKLNTDFKNKNFTEAKKTLPMLGLDEKQTNAVMKVITGGSELEVKKQGKQLPPIPIQKTGGFKMAEAKELAKVKLRPVKTLPSIPTMPPPPPKSKKDDDENAPTINRPR